MIDLEEDERSFEEIIDYYESHPDEYNKIIDRNYQLLFEKCTWTNHLDEILGKIH